MSETFLKSFVILFGSFNCYCVMEDDVPMETYIFPQNDESSVSGEDLEIDPNFFESHEFESDSRMTADLAAIAAVMRPVENIDDVTNSYAFVKPGHRDLLERRLKEKFAFSDFCRVSQHHVRNMASRGLLEKIDESLTVASNTTYHHMKSEKNTDRCAEYNERRNMEISSFYAGLGCSARMSDSNCFGSYRDVAREAYDRRAEWSTTSITSWLLSLKTSANWGGTEAPYTNVLPFLPPKVRSYLDFGCGSGNGARQVQKYLGVPECRDVYDISNHLSFDNGKKMNFISEIHKEYELVTAVNVLHHVDNLAPVMRTMMDSVSAGGYMLIKDHFVGPTNVCLAVLVHEMYDPSCELKESENLYFRSLSVIVDFIRHRGWTVDIHALKFSDVGDIVLVCRNTRDGGRSQIVHLEDKVAKLTQEVYDLKQMVSQNYNNPQYVVEPNKKKDHKPKDVIYKHNLASSSDDSFLRSKKKGKQKKLTLKNEIVTKKKVGASQYRDQPVVSTPLTQVWRPVGVVQKVPEVKNELQPVVVTTSVPDVLPAPKLMQSEKIITKMKIGPRVVDAVTDKM